MATSVERILSEVGPLAFPGVFDTLSAKLAARAGFPLSLCLWLFRGRHHDW